MSFLRIVSTTLFIFVLGNTIVFAEEHVLSSEQDLWLNKRNRTILVRPERNNPPFVFVPSGAGGQPQGLAVDYLDIVLSHINATPQYFEATSKSNILQALKEGKDGVALAMTQTDSRSQYLYFTKPFITAPAVIVVRKDAPFKKSELTLADFTGKRIAAVEASGVEDYIQANYKKIILEPVVDDEVGLQKLLLGEVDAAVIDIISLSYYTANKALSYVSVRGQTGFEYSYSFAVPKHLPELAMILDDGLQTVTPQEQEIIKEKWITVSIENQNKAASVYQFFGDNTVLVAGSIMAGTLIVLVSIILLMRALRKTQVLAMMGRPKKNDHDSSTESLRHELEELEEASKVVTEELIQIKELEKDIAQKIKDLKE